MDLTGTGQLVLWVRTVSRAMIHSLKLFKLEAWRVAKISRSVGVALYNALNND